MADGRRCQMNEQKGNLKSMIFYKYFQVLMQLLEVNSREEMKFYPCSVFFIRGRDRDFYFQPSLVVLFHSYPYAENLIAVLYSTLCPLWKTSQIFPHMKRRSAIFFITSGHLQHAEMQTVSHISMKIYKHHLPSYFKGPHT